MTALVTLSDNVFMPDGEEYRAVWGDINPAPVDAMRIGEVTLPLRMITCWVLCPRPQSSHTPEPEYKGQDTPTLHNDFKHIYYSE